MGAAWRPHGRDPRLQRAGGKPAQRKKRVHVGGQPGKKGATCSCARRRVTTRACVGNHDLSLTACSTASMACASSFPVRSSTIAIWAGRRFCEASRHVRRFCANAIALAGGAHREVRRGSRKNTQERQEERQPGGEPNAAVGWRGGLGVRGASCAGCTRRCKSCTRRLFLPAHDIPCAPHQAQPLTVRHRQSATEGPGTDRRHHRRDGSHHDVLRGCWWRREVARQPRPAI